MKTALVTGVSGQDGHFLSRLLLQKGYRVVGTTRNLRRGKQLLAPDIADALQLQQLDLEDSGRFSTLIDEWSPTEIYNLAASAKGSTMWDHPVALANSSGVAVAGILEAIRRSDKPIRFCQASSSEMFGHTSVSPQSEDSPFLPRSPYGAAKLFAHNMIRIYREHHKVFACSAILFNHESELRAVDFVTRKVTEYAAKIRLGLASELPIGNLETRRDWGYAGDYMFAMWKMLQHDEPMDYVVATGETHSVGDLCEIAFSHLGLDYRDHVVHTPGDYRSSEPILLTGDTTRIGTTLGWQPRTSFRQLIQNMVDYDLARLDQTSED